MSGRTGDVNSGLWVHLIGIGLLLFVIYVWRAPLDWLTDFIAGRMQAEFRDLIPTTTTTPTTTTP
jgi:hypothetical protein